MNIKIGLGIGGRGAVASLLAGALTYSDGQIRQFSDGQILSY